MHQTTDGNFDDCYNTYVDNEKIDAVEENLTRLLMYLKQEDHSQSLTLVNEIKFELNHIYESELPLLKNIL